MGTHPIFESDFDCLTETGFSKCQNRSMKLKNFWSRHEERTPHRSKSRKTRATPNSRFDAQPTCIPWWSVTKKRLTSSVFLFPQDFRSKTSVVDESNFLKNLKILFSSVNNIQRSFKKK